MVYGVFRMWGSCTYDSCVCIHTPSIGLLLFLLLLHCHCSCCLCCCCLCYYSCSIALQLLKLTIRILVACLLFVQAHVAPGSCITAWRSNLHIKKTKRQSLIMGWSHTMRTGWSVQVSCDTAIHFKQAFLWLQATVSIRLEKELLECDPQNKAWLESSPYKIQPVFGQVRTLQNVGLYISLRC